MANRKVVDLPELTTLSNDDELYIVDISDLTESSEGTSKKIKASNFVPAGGELKANKQNSLTSDGTGVKYPTVDAVRSEALLLSGTTVGNPVIGDISISDVGFLGVDTDNQLPALFNDDKTTFVSSRGFYTPTAAFEWDSGGWRSNINHSPNITDLDYPQKIYVDSGLASKADKQGTILYHSVRWFTPSSTVSNVGATVTSIGTQFTSSMVGSILRINNEDRLIITYTSTTVVVVESAYSTNYSGVLSSDWGVYGIITKVFSDGKIGFYNAQGLIQFGLNGGTDNSRLYATQFATYDASIGFGSFQLRLAGTNPINWSNNSQYGGTKDIGLRRNSAGILEIYDGVTADGTLTNRRDLLVRKLLVNKSTDNGVDSLQVDGTISMSPATLSTQGVVKSQLSTQYEVGANSNVLDVWMDNEVIFTTSCTITVPATLPTNFNFNWLTLAGVTVTWAITSPHTWLFGTPGNATEKTYGRMVKRNSTNSIIML